MDIVDQSPLPAPARTAERQTFLGHGVGARLSFVLAALVLLWLAIAAVVGWLR